MRKEETSFENNWKKILVLYFELKSISFETESLV